VTAFCHENPDGDTLGAAVAIALAAQRLGKQAEVVSVDGLPQAYAFLATDVMVRERPTLAPGLAVVCDAASLERIGSVLEDCRDWFAAATIANIDHHTTNRGFGAVNVVDPGAAATCQVVVDCLAAAGVELDQPIASALLAGLIRDSHGFSTETTTARTLAAAADAVEAGALIEPIYRSTLVELPLPTMALWGRLLNAMQIAAGGRIVHATLTEEMLAATGTSQHDADGFVEFLARGSGVAIGLLFRQLADGTRVSLRVAPGIDAASIAAEFGGGGHVRRAGCFLALPADEAVPSVVDACERYLTAGG